MTDYITMTEGLEIELIKAIKADNIKDAVGILTALIDARIEFDNHMREINDVKK